MSSGQPDDFFGIEYDYRGPKTESSPEKPQIPAQTSMSPQQRQEWEETEGTVDEKSNTQSDGSQIISTPYGTVRFDVTDGLHRANNSNSLLEGLKNR